MWRAPSVLSVDPRPLKPAGASWIATPSRSLTRRPIPRRNPPESSRRSSEGRPGRPRRPSAFVANVRRISSLRRGGREPPQSSTSNNTAPTAPRLDRFGGAEGLEVDPSNDDSNVIVNASSNTVVCPTRYGCVLSAPMQVRRGVPRDRIDSACRDGSRSVGTSARSLCCREGRLGDARGGLRCVQEGTRR